MKPRLYKLSYEDGNNITVHLERPVSFLTFMRLYVLRHEFLKTTHLSQNNTYERRNLVAIQKLENGAPDYFLSANGDLSEP